MLSLNYLGNGFQNITRGDFPICGPDALSWLHYSVRSAFGHRGNSNCDTLVHLPYISRSTVENPSRGNLSRHAL